MIKARFARHKVRLIVGLLISALLWTTSSHSSAQELTNQTAPYNAVTDVFWSVDSGQKFESFSQDFNFVNFEWNENSAPSNNWLHPTICWNRANVSLSLNESCAWFGLIMNSKRGSTIQGSFNFTFLDGTEFRIDNSRLSGSCRRENSSDGISAYTTCWVGVQLQEKRSYTMELLRDKVLGPNWWYARLVDSVSKEEIRIGSIRATYISENSPVTYVKNHLGFEGKPVACNAVPAMDSLLSAPRLDGKSLSYQSIKNGPCIFSEIRRAPSLDSTNYFLMMGGRIPILRDQTFKITRVTYTANSMEIEADTGGNVATAPDRILLVAPDLGIPSNQAKEAVIAGGKARWSIPLDNKLAGRKVRLEIHGESGAKRFTSAGTEVTLPGVKCPAIIDAQPSASQPKVLGFTFTGTSQGFVRVAEDSQVPVSSPSNLVGCYVVPEMINRESVGWQIGSISRDSNGFYFVNGEGVRWRLTLIDNGTRLENDPSAPYYEYGKYFVLNLGTSSGGTTEVVSRPSQPTFSAVNFVGNKINISVNLGSPLEPPPTKVYLIAPQLGKTSANPSEGRIVGRNASWSLDLGELKLGSPLKLEIVSERSGQRSESLTGTYILPTSVDENGEVKVPNSPKNLSTRVVGNTAFITVEVKNKKNGLPEAAYLYGRSINVEKSNALQGEVLGKKAVFELPVSSAMVGKRLPVKVVASNEAGDSKPLDGTVVIPSVPRVPVVTNAPKETKTIVCARTNQTRVFTGTKCPPGWNKR